MEGHNQLLMRPAFVAQNLRLAAQQRFGYQYCPCCAQPFESDPYVAGATRNPRRRTRGHNTPHSHGGKLWVYQCAGCNTDQRRQTFREWQHVLELAADPRAPNAAWLADLFDSFARNAL